MSNLISLKQRELDAQVAYECAEDKHAEKPTIQNKVIARETKCIWLLRKWAYERELDRTEDTGVP